MISKVANFRTQARSLSRLLTTCQRAFFSESSGSGDSKVRTVADVANETKGNKDEKYEELAFKFQEEWKKVYDERNTHQLQELEKELTPNQKKRIELLSQALLELNTFELRYFGSILRDKVMKTSGINPLKINLDWPALKQTELGAWPPVNPTYFMQQEAIAKLWPNGQQSFAQIFGGSALGGGGFGGAPAAQPQAEQPKEAAKPAAEEKPAEKEKFDLELAGFDATKKISIIKEVRELLKLGLKEAKEMVEKAPVVLKRDVKKEEAQQLKEKLAAIGCNVNLL